MGSYTKYDPRLESLVVETKTFFDPEIEAEVEKLDSELDRRAGKDISTKELLARAIHAHPESAAKINYERAHTGFTREITVTRADLVRLYQQTDTLDDAVDEQAGSDVDTKKALGHALGSGSH